MEVKDLLGSNFINKLRQSVTYTFGERRVYLFFTAGWCKHTISFIPIFNEWRRRMEKDYVVIVVPSDSGDDEFMKYFDSMDVDFAILPSDDRSQKIEEHYHIYGFPTVLVLDKDLSIVSMDKYSEILNDMK